jgi:hypothetical protein
MFFVAFVIVELNALFEQAVGVRRWLAFAALIPVLASGFMHYQMHTLTATGTDATPRIQEYETEMLRRAVPNRH